MKTKTIITVTLAFLLMGLANVPSTAAQLAPKQEEVQPKPSESYKVVFTLSELDNGKRINSRSYSMLIRAEALPKFTNLKQFRVGSRVPYWTGSGQGTNDIQYQDIGMDIDCRLMPMGNGSVVIDAGWNYTSVAPEPNADLGSHHPVFRQVRSNEEAVVPLDKPTTLAEMDDVASTHRYAFEVKVTKLSE